MSYAEYEETNRGMQMTDAITIILTSEALAFLNVIPNASPVPVSEQPVRIEEGTDATLWTIDDVAAYLKLHKTQIYNLMNDDGLPSFTIRKTRRFDPAQVRAWVQQQKGTVV